MSSTVCSKKVESHIGRALSEDELKIVEYLYSFGFGDLEIVEAIAAFIFLCYVAAIEKELGRKLSPAEKAKAKELFKKGVSAKNASNEFRPPSPPKPRSSSKLSR